MPYAMMAPGFKYGVLSHIIIILCMIFATHLYFKSKEMYGIDSLSELCYMAFGRASIFIINLILAFVIFGILILYMILFAKISLSLFAPTEAETTL